MQTTPQTPTEKELDEALRDTFPASDPISATAHLTATPTADHLGATEHSADHPGTVTVYRVVTDDQKDKPFGGGPNSAGRWTSDGTPAVYASMSPSAALLEFLVHCEGEPPRTAHLARANLPRARVTVVQAYPSTWRERPYRRDVQQVGDAWSTSHQSLAAQVPSALSEDSCNVLINPEHVDAPLIQGVHVTAIAIDDRLRNATRH
ncbi:RES family NAD+ phosphorylase [Lysobacter claricitrinus]|uniref:RES family NAD+ phosphorylase n=1 Tax=Lysobacter claricitrinus TaxID=3367728 RepID=UPI0037DB10A6